MKMILRLKLFLILTLTLFHSTLAVVPTFDRQNENVTVIIGNSVVLPCFISNLGDHKVAWIKVANMDILAIGDYKVTNDDRIKLVHGYLSDWSLSIQPVNEEDSGEYICQVNTEPQIITKIYLNVLLPPKINEEKSTINPPPIREGQSLTLYCHAEGIPTPSVSWYFRKRLTSPMHHLTNEHPDHKSIKLHEANTMGEKIFQEGNTLFIQNITRSHSGIFECIANNSVPPAASRKIKITVEFPTEIHVPSSKIEQAIGHNARLECKIKANPLINHYWMRNGQIIENSLVSSLEGSSNYHKEPKYEISIYNQNTNEYLTVSVLHIKNLSKEDFGLYECYGVNAHQTAKGEIELKEVVSHKAMTTKEPASRILIFSNTQQDDDYPSDDSKKDNRYDFGLLESHITKSNSQSKQRKTLNNTLKANKSNRLNSNEDENKDDFIHNGTNKSWSLNSIPLGSLTMVISFFSLFESSL